MKEMKIAGTTIKGDEELMKILSGKPTEISVWGDGKHRSAIYDPVLVIANDKDELSEAEILVITENDVVRFSFNDNGTLRSQRTKIGEVYNQYGKKIIHEHIDVK